MDNFRKLKELDYEWYKMVYICHSYATHREEIIDVKQVININSESKIKELIDIDREDAKTNITNTMNSII